MLKAGTGTLCSFAQVLKQKLRGPLCRSAEHQLTKTGSLLRFLLHYRPVSCYVSPCACALLILWGLLVLCHCCPGKYTPDGPRPTGPRGNIYSNKISEIQPLISLMKAVGEERGKSPAQVCQNRMDVPW